LVSLGIFAASYQAGLAADTGFSLSGSNSAAGAATETTPTNEVSATPDASASASAAASAETGSSSTSNSASASGSAAATPTATKSATTTTASVSQTGAAIDTGKGYGFVQVEVVKTNGKISAINMVRAEASDGRSAAFPSLVAAAVQANGTGFGNVSGATYTTNAFKKAVESALAKF
jgi:uncharacterized protein with FMN-binding domain